MKKEEVIKSIGKIDKLIDNINDLVMKNKKRKLTELELRMLRGYSIKHTLWLTGAVKLDDLSPQEYVDSYHLFEEAERKKKKGVQPKMDNKIKDNRKLEDHNVAFKEKVLENKMFDEYDRRIIQNHLSNFYCVFQLGLDAGRELEKK